MSEFENKFLTPQNATPEVVADEPIQNEIVTTIPEENKVETHQEIIVPDYFKKVEDISGGKYKFTKDEELKEFFDKHDKISNEFDSLKAKEDWYNEVEKYVDEHKNELNPILQLESQLGEGSVKKAMAAMELSKLGDKSIALQLVNDIDNIDGLEFLAKYAQFESQIARKNPEAALRSALKSAGIQISKEDEIKEVLANLDDDDKISIEAKVREKKSLIKTTIDSVKVPEYIDPITVKKNEYEQRKTKSTELKGKWQEVMTPLKASFDKLTFKDADFEFEIPEEDKKILDDFINVASMQGREPNEAQKAEILQRAKDAIWDKNRVKIMQSFKAKIETDSEKRFMEKYKNLKPLDYDKNPGAVPTDDGAKAALRRQMGLH